MGSHPSVADLLGVVAGHLPDYPVDSVVRIGAGLDNTAYEVNGELVVRFSRKPDPDRVDDEARLLTVLGEVSPLPVPVLVFADPAQSCLAYTRLAGLPLLEVPRQQRSGHGESVATALGGLLSALHSLPLDRLAGLVDTDDHPLGEWRREAAENYRAVATHVPAAYHRSVEAFLAAAPPDRADTAVFSHGDLGIEHVLVDPDTGAVTGVIDWSDAAIVDPAYDFGLVYRDLGPAALRAALVAYRTGADVAALCQRATFYARCNLFEDLLYGIETDQERYVDKSLAALDWLFPA
ncbi:hypothetical protein GCM10027290_28920 [Micromonospora sonneratiae]|uniref:Phosphotransferase family protein n=1 Tax=Micromonospora sonneratiae TaxID=1184706 RepID=A0ABW3Y8E3_9ACTN